MEVALVLLRVARVAAREAVEHLPASVALVLSAPASVPTSAQLQWVSVPTPKMTLLLYLQRAALRMHACDLVVKEIVDLEEGAFAAR